MSTQSPGDGTLPRAAIIAHPGKIDMDALRAAVDAAETRHHWNPSTWFETTPERLGDVLAREAVEAGHDLVVAAGGDGTVRAVIEALEGTDVPLGIVPAGTGNLLARNLGIDVLSMNVAVDTAFAGRPARIDVGHATAERPSGAREKFVFAVLGGIGVDAGMIANTPDDLKKRVGWLAYLTGIWRTIASGAHFTARVRVDQHATHSMRAQSLMIGNCGLMPGGVLLLPDAEVDDGKLDMCVLRPQGLMGWLHIWTRMVWQTIVARRARVSGRRLQAAADEIHALRYEQGESVVFRLTSGPEEFEIDGEAVGKVVAAHLTVSHRALLVHVPGGDSATAREQLLLEEVIGRGRRHRERVQERVKDIVDVVGKRLPSE